MGSTEFSCHKSSSAGIVCHHSRTLTDLAPQLPALFWEWSFFWDKFCFYPWLAWNSWYWPGWPQTRSEPLCYFKYWGLRNMLPSPACECYIFFLEFMCMTVLPRSVCVHVCTVCTHARLEKGVGSSRTKVPDGCEPPCACWGSNLWTNSPAPWNYILKFCYWPCLWEKGCLLPLITTEVFHLTFTWALVSWSWFGALPREGKLSALRLPCRKWSES